MTATVPKAKRPVKRDAARTKRPKAKKPKTYGEDKKWREGFLAIVGSAPNLPTLEEIWDAAEAKSQISSIMGSAVDENGWPVNFFERFAGSIPDFPDIDNSQE